MNYIYSLIIPHHNMPDRLRRLLKSIPRRSDLQVLVIDDCSNKCMEEYIVLQKEYDWVEWYTTPTNGGAGKARNIGIDHAKGRYVLFADSDDFFNPNFNDTLDKYLDSDYDIVYFTTSCLTEYTFENNNYLNFLNGTLHRYLKDVENIKYRLTYPWSKLISMGVIKFNDIRFEESIVSNDVKFAMLCDYYAKKLKIDATAIYCYMLNTVSVSRSLNAEKILARLRVDAWRWRFVKDNHIKGRSLSLMMGGVMEKVNAYMNFHDKKKSYEICKEYGISFVQFLCLLIRSKVKKLYYKIH